MIKYKDDNHNQTEFASLVLLLAIFYTIKSAEILPFDIIPATWLLFGVYTLIRIKARAFFISTSIYTILLTIYSLGASLGLGESSDFDYLRIFPSFFIFTTLTLGIITNNTKNPNWIAYKIFSSKLFISIGFFIVLIWSIFIFKMSEDLGGFIVKEFGGSNYLTSSDLLAISSLIAISLKTISQKEKILLVFITLLALTLLGSRSSLIVYCGSLIFSFGKISFPRKIIFIILFISAIATAWNFIEKSESDLFYRVKTLTDLSADESKNYRNVLLGNFRTKLNDQPECLLLPCHPESGVYVHNIISIQQYFGFLGSLLVLCLIIISSIYFLKIRKIPFCATFLYIIGNFIFSRSWVSLVFPVLLGFLLAYSWLFNNLKKNQKTTIYK